MTALDPAAGVATSEVIAIRFSPAAIEGGLYYLATNQPSGGIQRHVFGAVEVQAMVAPQTRRNAFDCGGCHSVSRDGTTLAFCRDLRRQPHHRSDQRPRQSHTPAAAASPDRADAVAPGGEPRR